MVAYFVVLIVLLQIYSVDGASGDLTVSLVVFSGHPNPKWKILSTNPGYKEIVTKLQNAKNAKLTHRPVDMPARLGYKGFLVQNMMKKESDLIVGPKTATLQKLLLKTMPIGIISKAKLQSVSEEINQGKVYADVQTTKRFAPDYFPSWWNGNPNRLENNNCYNYANDIATGTFAQPGGAHALRTGLIANIDDYDLAVTSGAVVQAAAVNDGLQVVNVPRPPQGPFVQNPLPKVPKGPRHLVALVVDVPGDDFHWYRLDSDGKWSHKPGPTRVSQYDNAGHYITDPRKCNMGNYRFVGFMSTDKNTVVIR